MGFQSIFECHRMVSLSCPGELLTITFRISISFVLERFENIFLDLKKGIDYVLLSTTLKNQSYNG